MKIRGEMWALGLLFALLVIAPIASAEIFIDGFESTYNLGDELNVSMTVSSSAAANDFLVSKLVCTGLYYVTTNKTSEQNGTNVTQTSSSIKPGTREIELYRGALSVDAGGEKEVSLSIRMNKGLIEDLNGDCIIRATYNKITADSGAFELTSGLDVGLDLSGIKIMPEEEMNVIGSAYRRNGEAINGFVEASINSLSLNVSGTVKDGIFNFSFTIPRDAHAGEYELVASAYERDGEGNKVNEGIARGSFRVKQINDKIDLAFSSQIVTPGSDFTFTALLYDQAGDDVSDDVAVSIYYPNGTLIEKRLARAGKAEGLKIGQTDVPGYWKVDAVTGKLEASKTFYVEELQKAEFSIANDTLTIANVGNVDYTKAVEITIGDKKEIIQVNISVGGIKKFKIYAPEGEYDISVNDGSQVNNFGTSFLTGRAISVQDITNLTSSMPFMIVVWIIVILVVAAIALYIYRKVARGSYSGRMPSFARSEEGRPMMLGAQSATSAAASFRREEREEKDSVAPATSAFNQDEQRMRQRITSALPSMAPPFVVRKEKEEYAKSSATMERAQKQESSIVCLNVKNMGELMTSKGGALGALDRALSKAKSARAKIYIDGDYRVIIFAPAITRESANETRAINAAKQIEEVLTEYNKLHVQKVSFGIGVNSGELIAESRDGGFKFTSVGNTISAAKRISDSADSEILLSEMFHRKTAGTVKVEPGKGAWRIKRIVNRERNSEFINKFMDRQRKQR